jgi:hypothetical protein
VDRNQVTPDVLRRILIDANPALSRFNPLPRILFHNDFDNGAEGWCELAANHDNNLDTLRPIARDLRPPQLSTCTFFDTGTHGSVSGTYALKLATRPIPNHMSFLLKRFTYPVEGLVQFETYFTFKSEVNNEAATGGRAWDGNYHPSAAQFGEFTISNDVGEPNQGKRWQCALRYQNTDEAGNLVQRWKYKTSLHPTTKMVVSGAAPPVVDFHAIHPTDWEDVPNGYQPLCYNEVPTKINWHYLRWSFDLRTRRNTELQVNSLTMDLREIDVPVYPEPYWGLDNLLNFCVDVRTFTNVRNFLWLDSVLVSADW